MELSEGIKGKYYFISNQNFAFTFLFTYSQSLDVQVFNSEKCKLSPIYLYKEGEEWEEGDETLITWGERWLGERRSGDGVWRDTPRKKLDRLKGKDGGVAFKFIQRAGV
ncbi:hypothetical protein QTP88_006556 [Uroleucon formosanum]